MYTSTDFKTKKALREAVAAGERVTYYQPAGNGDIATINVADVKGNDSRTSTPRELRSRLTGESQ